MVRFVRVLGWIRLCFIDLRWSRRWGIPWRLRRTYRTMWLIWWFIVERVYLYYFRYFLVSCHRNWRYDFDFIIDIYWIVYLRCSVVFVVFIDWVMIFFIVWRVVMYWVISNWFLVIRVICFYGRVEMLGWCLCFFMRWVGVVVSRFVVGGWGFGRCGFGSFVGGRWWCGGGRGGGRFCSVRGWWWCVIWFVVVIVIMFVWCFECW